MVPKQLNSIVISRGLKIAVLFLTVESYHLTFGCNLQEEKWRSENRK